MLAFNSVLCAILLSGYVAAAPAASSSDVSSVASLSLTSEAASATPSSAVVSASAIQSSAISSSAAVSVSALASGTSSALPASETVPYASDDPNDILWSEDSTTNPQPIRESLGATILGPQNVPVALQNPDMLAPPTTDNGNM